MSHHYSGPNFGFPGGDARLDFTDLYAFPKPGDPSKSILIMNVHPSFSVNPPGPTTAEPFAPKALYEIKIDTNGAERVVQVGGVAEGTARLAAQRTQLKPYPLEIATGREHCDALSSALATFGAAVRKGIDEAHRAGDEDTADLFTEISRGTDQWLWFVEAHLQADA